MKKLKFILSLFIAVLFLTTYAQDVVVLKNYDILNVKVIKVSSENIEFKYENEELINEMPVSKIKKIQFASGRVQEFSSVKSNENTANNEFYEAPKMDENQTAIIPFSFYDSETGKTFGGKKSLEVQRMIYRELQSHGISNVQSINNTNAYLRKAKIDYTKIENYTLEEISKALGCGTIIYGDFKIEETENASYVEHGGTINKEYVGTDVYVDEYGDVVAEDVYVDTYQPGFVEAIVWKNKRFIGTINIVENGVLIHSDQRDPFFQSGDGDGWTYTLERLLAKSPYGFRY